MALIFCFAAHNKVVTLLPATAAAVSTLAIPVVGLLSSAWLLGEPVGWREFAALLLVVAAIALVLLPDPRSRVRRPHEFDCYAMLCHPTARGYNPGG